MIKEFIFLGDRDERNNIFQLYQKEKKNILISFLHNKKYRNYTKTIDTVYDHFGEKFAFYFAWLLHYTAWLIIPSIIGGIFWLI